MRPNTRTPTDPGKLPADHPLTILIARVEAAGGAVVAGLAPLGINSGQTVPTVIIELCGVEAISQAPTFRQIAALLEPRVAGLLA